MCFVCVYEPNPHYMHSNLSMSFQRLSPSTGSFQRLSPSTRSFQCLSPSTNSFQRLSPSTNSFQCLSPSTRSFQRLKKLLEMIKVLFHFIIKDRLRVWPGRCNDENVVPYFTCKNQPCFRLSIFVFISFQSNNIFCVYNANAIEVDKNEVSIFCFLKNTRSLRIFQ